MRFEVDIRAGSRARPQQCTVPARTRHHLHASLLLLPSRPRSLGGCSTSSSLPAEASRVHTQDSCSRGRQASHVCHSTDYIASVSDQGVLKMSARTELDIDEITDVFGFPRNLEQKYILGKVIGE